MKFCRNINFALPQIQSAGRISEILAVFGCEKANSRQSNGRKENLIAGVSESKLDFPRQNPFGNKILSTSYL